MEMMDDKKFYQQIEQLKQETFWEYLSHSYRFFSFVPLLCLLDFLFYPHFSWWFVLKLILLLGCMLFFFWTYVFYRKIDKKRNSSFLFFRLFVMYALCNGIFMMIVMTNVYRIPIEKGSILSNCVGSIVFGIIMGAVYAGCSYERIKEYLGSKKE